MAKFVKLGSRFYNTDLIASFWLEPNILDGEKMLTIQFRDGHQEKVFRGEGVTTYEKLITSGGGCNE